MLRRTVLTAALVAAALAVPCAAAADPVTARDLPRLQAELAQVTARAQVLSDRLEQEAARDGGLRVAVERLAEEHDRAQARLDARARLVYMRTAPDPLFSLRSLAAPGLRRIVQKGSTAALTVDRDLVDAVAEQSAQVLALQARAARFRAGLRRQAAQVLAAQDQARTLLAEAEALAAQEQAAAELARLAEQRAALDAVSATVTLVLSPAQTERSRRAARDQGPVLAAVEAAGDGYPAGYRPSGQTFSGTASWYGPGFVGSPTASGAPYDPERLTCANKELPLGTVIRVSANGRAISCLVNDRGPYVGDRVLDMSRAGSRALGYEGLAQVTVEVLSAVG
ncbi:MAG: septal ring lytic transglycosylase RlpA family protein [Actinobacteria bacterium]|nr:septal ring lytic transglycosylase RlpA family protein [Actinomycetota bacterium]MCA1721574.1 septal ring lytic transglycosylase RlpA family protein [Actinomycetota bacterium]